MGTPIRVLVALSAALIMFGVSLLDLPPWIAGLLTAGLMLVAFSVLQAVLRWRWRVNKAAK